MSFLERSRTMASALLLGTVLLTVATGCSLLSPTPVATSAAPTSERAPSPPPTPEPAPSADGAESQNDSAVMQEYREAARELEDELPDGYVFPGDFPQGRADMAPEGTGIGAAHYYWRCAWTAQFLVDFDAHDKGAIERDLDTLETWQHFPWVRDNGALDGLSWTDDVIQPAREGKIGVLRTLGLGGCNEVVMGDPGSADALSF